MDWKILVYIVVLINGATSIHDKFYEYYDIGYDDFSQENNKPERKMPVIFKTMDKTKDAKGVVLQTKPYYPNKQVKTNKLNLIMNYLKKLYMLVQQLYQGVAGRPGKMEKPRPANGFNVVDKSPGKYKIWKHFVPMEYNPMMTETPLGPGRISWSYYDEPY